MLGEAEACAIPLSEDEWHFRAIVRWNVPISPRLSMYEAVLRGSLPRLRSLADACNANPCPDTGSVSAEICFTKEPARKNFARRVQRFRPAQSTNC